MRQIIETICKLLVAGIVVCLTKAATMSEWVLTEYAVLSVDNFVVLIVCIVMTALVVTFACLSIISYAFKEEPPPAPVCRFIYHRDEREDFLRSDKYQAFELQAMAHKALSITSIPVDHLGEYTEWANSQYLYSFTPMALNYLSNSLVSFERSQGDKLTKQNVITKGI